jgi:DNA-binding MarR family transcriptional regulator
LYVCALKKTGDLKGNTKDIDKSLVIWLSRTVKFIDYFISEGLRIHGINLTKAQMILLHRLRLADGQSQHSLAFITNRDKASLARLLTTMENKNLVARIPSKTDGRVNLIYLTKHGEELLDKTEPIMKELIDELQMGLSMEEVENIISGMKKIQSNIKTEDFVAIETK